LHTSIDYVATVPKPTEVAIKSIKKGTRCGDSIGKDLEFFFNQLEKSNKELYNDLYMKYSLARLEFEKKLEDIHS
jgi:hypothetical protein